MSLIDAAQRETALNIHESILVQAPAGSGKTELLTQRILKLLGESVRYPEEITAITFTKKAAGEMRHRIMQALQFAATCHEPPEAEHMRKTWQLAKRALAQNEIYNWQLLENPNRLKLYTIDAFCARLTRQMPVLSSFGAMPDIEENVDALYFEASNEILLTLNADVPWQNALSELLIFFDNDQNKLQRLFVNMLKNRDQWLPYIMNPNPRSTLENNLKDLVNQTLENLDNFIALPLSGKLIELIQFAAQNLKQSNPEHPLTEYSEITRFYPAKAENLSYWQALIKILLTSDGKWRSRFSKNEGFPAPTSATNTEDKKVLQYAKASMAQVMAELSKVESLNSTLQEILKLPCASYQDDQWQLIEALFTLLPILVAQLHILFKVKARVDHTEITLKALSALGTPEQPTDLTLSLDYKIKHILVDEFQDTSVNQFRLLEMLTLEWLPHEAKTLFLVGDPMQSIYRFRKAEVGLFLKARDFGINQIALKFIQLKVNFRSSATIVNWNNCLYEEIFPKQDSLSNSQVSYAKALAFHEDIVDSSVTLSPLISFEEDINIQEAKKTIEIISTTWKNCDNSKIAILVSARSHLKEILKHLQKHQIPYRAVDS